jgi:hypothetical protein
MLLSARATAASENMKLGLILMKEHLRSDSHGNIVGVSRGSIMA